MKFDIYPEQQIPRRWDTESEHRIYCDATTLIALFAGFEPLSLKQQQQRKPGSWHWHIIAERSPISTSRSI